MTNQVVILDEASDVTPEQWEAAEDNITKAEDMLHFVEFTQVSAPQPWMAELISKAEAHVRQLTGIDEALK